MSKRKHLIYIVEDNPVYAKIIVSALHKESLKFKHFMSGEEMLDALDVKPDILILDVNISNEDDGDVLLMNGLEIMVALKAKQISLPTIILSGINDVQLAIDTLKYNANEYIVKNDEAIIKVEQAIDKIINLKESKREIDKYQSKTQKLKKHIVFTFMVVLLILFVLFSLTHIL